MQASWINHLHSLHSIYCGFIQVAVISMESQCMANEVYGVVVKAIFSAKKKKIAPQDKQEDEAKAHSQ